VPAGNRGDPRQAGVGWLRQPQHGQCGTTFRRRWRSRFIVCEAASGKQPQQNEVNVQVRRWLAEVQNQAEWLEMRYEFEIRNLDFGKCGSITVQGNVLILKNSPALPLYSQIVSGLISEEMNIFLIM